MSEINSIANGTYTIGQTSATNFVAGPGIKIDEPSAGTVRIGNDETVLWGNTNGATSATLSESIFNFERIKIYYAAGDRAGTIPSMELIVTSDVVNEGIQIVDWIINADGTFEVVANGYYTVSQSGNELNGTVISHMWFSIPNFNYNGKGSSGVKLFKVVGINRISGSNA